MSVVVCPECDSYIDTDYHPEVFRAELGDKVVCDTCWLNNYQECEECEQIFPTSEMPRLIDPWGGDHGITGRCEKCEDNYDPTPYAYDSEPPITDEERYQMAAKQKRELR